MLHHLSIFIGRLHPMLVHLPIGILLMALLLQLLSTRKKYQPLSAAIPILLLAGVISAVITCISGLFLANSGEYDPDAVNLHEWMGISTALVSGWLYSQKVRGASGRNYNILSIVLLALIFVTGHLGGSLTHGSDYLSSAFSDSSSGNAATSIHRKPIADIQQAMVYNDVVEPLLAARCYSCHGPNKQKGKLQMDQPALLMRGGKNGSIIKPGKPTESELIKRLTLPLDDEHHMAPKEKGQLSQQQIALLSWWIGAGAPFNKKIQELPQPAAIKTILLSLQSSTSTGSTTSSGTQSNANASGVTGTNSTDPTTDEPVPPANTDLPADPVTAADEKSLAALRASGAVAMPVAQNSHYIEVNFVNNTRITDEQMKLLSPLRQQLVSLKCSRAAITDAGLETLSSCKQLIRLDLDHTSISDKGLRYIAGMQHLKYINLGGTGITAEGVLQLKGLKEVKAIFLYQTHIDRRQWPDLQKAFPATHLDSGGYIVPLLPVDTQLVRAAR